MIECPPIQDDAVYSPCASIMGSVGAERMNPLALMIRPRGSSPHHSVALVLALTAIRASEPLPLVHIISSTPSMLIALAAKTPIE